MEEQNLVQLLKKEGNVLCSDYVPSKIHVTTKLEKKKKKTNCSVAVIGEGPGGVIWS